ncbi:MAG: DUF1385 domain-containing protein [Chloroflexi bacterium CFX7]|nr:DUF1385 domain-containing protein [Chloroflexi bacterium CFX7]RIL01952.1 MAG: DUF1385 domain-containing protein [bacterium]
MTVTNAPAGPANVYYGGQAVLEGVMIRGPEHMAVAVRHPRGHIVRHSEKLGSLYTGRPRRIPLLRGIVVLWETMALGMRALSFSSRVAMEEEDENGETAEFPESVFWGSMVFAMLFMVGVFFAGPILLANLLEMTDAHRFLIVLVEGIVRLGLFVGYIALIGLIPDIRRVFQYHGAEHMTIHAYEAGRPLTVEAVRPYPKEHTRCGTSFLLVVVVVALLTFFAFDLAVDRGILVRTASRIVFIPVIAGVSYEILRVGARFGGNWFVHAMFVPNLALQALTTKVPDDSQIEVAIASFEATLEAAGVEPVAASALAAAPPLD